MGHRKYKKAENKTRGEVRRLNHQCLFLDYLQSIIIIPRKNRLRIYVDGSDKYYRLHELKRGLPNIAVKGVPTISRAIINIKDQDDAKGKKGDKELLVEGYGLQKCMITEGSESLVKLRGSR